MNEADDRVQAVETVDLVIRPGAPAFAAEERGAIEARWAATRAANPGLWNGPFYLFDSGGGPDADGVFRAEGLATDFASFLHWRAGDPPDPRHRHIFPVGAVITTDERLMIGRMAMTTANPGRRYPPSGSFDPHDLVAHPDGRDRLDAEANMIREIGEEVGMDASGWPRDPGWLVVPSGPRRHAVVRVLRAPAAAAELAEVAAAHMAAEAEPELDAVDFVPLGEIIDPATTVPYVNVLLAHLGRRG